MTTTETTAHYAHRDGTACHDVECPRLARCSHGVPQQWLARGEYNCSECRREADHRHTYLGPDRRCSCGVKRPRRKGSY